jgi:hypothetical protein
MIGAVVEVGKLLEVVFFSLGATIGVATLFALAIFGVAQASDRPGRDRGRGFAYGALAVICLGGCMAAAAYGVVLLASK